jgi:hypothetical protein
VTPPYVGAEVLYDTRYDAWSQQRYEVGVEIVLSDGASSRTTCGRTTTDRSPRTSTPSA